MMWNTSSAWTEVSVRPDATFGPGVARPGPKRSAGKWVGNGPVRRGRHKARAPSDFDDPKPDPFLARKEQCAALAMELLLQAVADWSAGGKTSRGYWRMA
jgi:hypothetical protein